MATQSKINTQSNRSTDLSEQQAHKNGGLLLIVDVQNGFINESTKHIPYLVADLQMQYTKVYATRFYNEENSFFRTLLKWHRLSKDSPEFTLAFSPSDHTNLIDKNIYSCVNQDFLNILMESKCQTIDICGIDTDICVTKCAVDLFENGFVPNVLANFCASHAGIEAHENGLKTLGRYIGESQIIR